MSTDAPPPGYAYAVVEQALAEVRIEQGLDTYSDEWRHECEVRVIANMETARGGSTHWARRTAKQGANRERCAQRWERDEQSLRGIGSGPG